MSERMNPKLTGRRPATAEQDAVPIATTTASPVPAAAATTTKKAKGKARRSDLIDKLGESAANIENIEEGSIFDGATEHKNPRKHLMHDGKWCPKEWLLGRPVLRTGVWTCCGELEHLSIYCASEAVKKAFRKETEDIAQDKLDEIEQTSKRKEQLRNSIKLAQEANPEALQLELTKDEQAIKDACSTEDNGFNAPM
jgi:hypothetical protein